MMNSWLYWPIVAVIALGFLLLAGLAQFALWKLAVDAYTAYFKWRCRRDPVFFMRRVLGLRVTPLQAEILRGPINVLRERSRRLA